MKNKAILTHVIIASICIVTAFSCQPCTKLKVAAGPVYSGFCGESDSWTRAFGVQAGAATNVLCHMELPVKLWAEFNISMQGAAYEDDWGEGPVEGMTRLWYANIPLVARYQHESGFYGEAGIQPGFLLSAMDKFQGESYSYRDWVNTFDLGIPIGVGREFDNNFGVSLRVIPGLTNINAGEGDISRDRNFVVALRGTYNLRLRK
jgi:hypothetical protein